MTEAVVEAMLHEREGCVAAGLAARVRHIDDVLFQRFGIRVDDGVELAVEPAPETAARPRGRPRKR